MCGIAGFYGPFNEHQLANMSRSLSHRGPDDEGLEMRPGLCDGEQVGFGHRRLSIIDLAGGHQPMWTGNGMIGIIFNGEIYNYRELRRRLSADGGHFRTQSDTEVILEGWRLWGERILSALSGMFAFAMWDERTGEWILARDRAGIKPLYYMTPARGQLLFASEIKALLPFAQHVRPHLPALYDYLLYGWTSGPDTIFAGVRHLAPGHVMRWRPGDVAATTRTYVTASSAPAAHLGHEEAVRTLRETVDRAVQAHLVADVPVGVNLSGGLDSSVVVASAARLRDPSGINAFTVGFGLSDDETPYASEMARHVGVHHHVRTVSRERVVEDFASVVRTIEEPIGHPMLQTTFEISRFVREHLKVVLIGEGADELFLGYPQYQLLRAPFRYAPRAAVQSGYLAVACLMPPARRLARMLAPEFLEPDLLQASARRFDPYFREGDVAEGGQAFEIDHPLVANQLMRIDKLTMAHSVEARVPFLDNELMVLAKSLPLAYKLRGRVTKAILRDAAADRLPERILHRPKTGKGGTQALLPYLQRLVADGPLSDLISRESIGRRGWLNPDRVLGYLAEAHQPLVRYNPIERRRRAKFAWALAVLEQWAREYLD